MEIYETGNCPEKTDKPHSCILIEKGLSLYVIIYIHLSEQEELVM